MVSSATRKREPIPLFFFAYGLGLTTLAIVVVGSLLAFVNWNSSITTEFLRLWLGLSGPAGLISGVGANIYLSQ
jgi:hypothetical protein